MIGIALATATAGIIVGTVTLTGLGLVMTEIVETVSGGNIIACCCWSRHLPDPRHGHADDGELHRRGDADGAGGGRARRADRSRRAARRGAHVRLLFRPDGGRDAAGRARGVRGGGDLGRRSDEDRHHGVLVQQPHRRSCRSCSSSIRAAADRHRLWWHLVLRRRGAIAAMLAVRRRHAGLVPHAQPLVRVGRCCCSSRSRCCGPASGSTWRDDALRRRARSSWPSSPRRRRRARGLRVRIEGTTLEGKRRAARRCCCRSATKANGAQRIARSGVTTMTLPTGVAGDGGHAQQRGRQGRLRAGLQRHRRRDSSARARRKEWLFVPALLLLALVMLLQRRRIGATGATPAVRASTG